MVEGLFRKQHPEVGARPGTLAISEQALAPRASMIDYFGAVLNQRDAVDDPQELKHALRDGSITWVNVQGFGDESFFQQIGEIFNLHPLMLEDVVNVPQRPKVEQYGDQLLIIVRMFRLNDDGSINAEQVSFVLGSNYVLTFQEQYGDVFDPVRVRIKNPNGSIRQNGPDFLAYALIDTIVDAYYPVLESVGDQLESLENEVIENPTPRLLGQLNNLKNRLVNLRRGMWPQREAISSLYRDDHAIITDNVRLFFRDTHDHCVQTSEVIEMYREMVTGLMNMYLSSIANRTNDVMKILTIVATIFIPLTFLAGIYGMNFEYMPELHHRWAYPAVWIVMVTVTVGMLSFFWRRGWIGPQNSN